MNILLVHPAVIPPKKYGGTERVLFYLGEALAKLGHKVFCLVSKGSECDFAELIEYDFHKPLQEQIPDNIDIVHFHAKPAQKIKQPYIVTIHGNGKENEVFDLNTVFVSRNHALRHGSESFVYNGLNWDRYGTPDLNNKRLYFHFLGKASIRKKNLKGAIEVILKTHNEKLHVLGGYRFNLSGGIRFTFSPRIIFHGMVDDKKKAALLNKSKGLIFPVLWNEPMGLAVIESLYMGCPVFGTPYGSLPELISSEVGFLSNKSEELADAVLNADKYNRKVCHEYAGDNFNSMKMAKDYLEKYELILSGKKLNKKPPKFIKELNKKEFLWQ